MPNLHTYHSGIELVHPPARPPRLPLKNRQRFAEGSGLFHAKSGHHAAWLELTRQAQRAGRASDALPGAR